LLGKTEPPATRRPFPIKHALATAVLAATGAVVAGNGCSHPGVRHVVFEHGDVETTGVQKRDRVTLALQRPVRCGAPEA
jgi:hypothetical protein